MRTRDVRLVAGASALALVLAAAGAAWVASRVGTAAPAAGAPEEPAPEGSAVFARHCAACHAPEEVAPEAPATGAEVVALLRFLETHGAADAREDLALAAYLLELER